MKNIFQWSKFKPRSHDIFFSGTFDLILINSSRYLLSGVYYSPHHRNIVSKYKLQRKPIIKKQAFSLVSFMKKTNILKVKKLKIPYEQSLIFTSFMNTFSEAAVR